jgi:hypothetical protein
MKGNSAIPGGSLQSKPTWSSTSGCSATSAFFSVAWIAVGVSRNGDGTFYL